MIKFVCGGYLVGIGISYLLFDGILVYEFFYVWVFNFYNYDKFNGKIINKKDNMVIKLVYDWGNLLVNGDMNWSFGVIMVVVIYYLY